MRLSTSAARTALPLPWTLLVTNRPEGVFLPAGLWQPIGTLVLVRGWGELSEPTGDLVARPAVQVAPWASPRSGARTRGAVTATTTVLRGEGAFPPGPPVEIHEIAGAAAFRVGWVVASPSGAVVQAHAGGVVELAPREG